MCEKLDVEKTGLAVFTFIWYMNLNISNNSNNNKNSNYYYNNKVKYFLYLVWH